MSKRIDGKIAEYSAFQIDELSKAENFVFQQEFEEISWQRAKKLLFEKNISYQTSLASLKDSERRKKDIWLDLLPDIFTFVNLSVSFTQLGSLSSDNINQGISSRLRIPSPISLYRQSYSNGLQIVGQQFSHELLRRNLTSELYQLFLDAKRAKAEVTSRRGDLNLENVPLADLPEVIKSQKQFESRNRFNTERFRLRVNRLLNTPGKNWELVGSIPTINYQSRIDNLNLRGEFGSLGLSIQSLQIEAAVIGLKASELERLPSLSWNVSSPNVFDSTRDDRFRLDGDDFSLFTNVQKSIQWKDLFDRRGVEDARFRFRINRERLALQFERDSSQLVINKLRYKELLSQMHLAQRKVKEFQKGNGSTSPERILKDVELLDQARKQHKELKEQLLNMDLQFWIWDEKYWSEN